jgi:uncharacterized repeat protein (TIGR02543 family)
MFELTATGSNVTRTSATQFTVKINVSWETYYSGAQTNYGMTASSGGGSVTLNKFGTYASNGSGSFPGVYSISGNGSATKEIAVTFKNFNNDNGDSATTTVKFNVDVPAWTSYTISYNANGGSGAPSKQTKWKDQTLTLSSTKPTRTGYTFKGWALSKADADNGTWYYQAGGTCGKNENLTLYAVWEEHKLTINYYSNYATSSFADALNAVGSDKNVKVWTYDFYYDNDYSTYGLANYSNSTGSVYMTRIGHTGTGYWGTSTNGGTLIGENTGFVTGQALAEAVGKSLKTGNASINLYAQWRTNVLTIKYDVNGGVINSDKYYVNNGLVYLLSSSAVLADKWNYNNGHDNGLYNAATFGLTKEGYDFVGWSVDSYDTTHETVFDEDDASIVPTDLDRDIERSDSEITLKAVWKLSGVIYIDNKETFEPYLVYIDNGTSWDLYIAYIDNGTSWDIVS